MIHRLRLGISAGIQTKNPSEFYHDNGLVRGVRRVLCLAHELSINSDKDAICRFHIFPLFHEKVSPRTRGSESSIISPNSISTEVHEEDGNDHKLKKLLIVKQILFNNTKKRDRKQYEKY